MISDDDPDAETLGAIVAEVIDRRRNGEAPQASEYAEKYPHLVQQLEEHLSTIDLLEGGGQVARQARALGECLQSFPLQVQRLIFLRAFERRRWEDIARSVGVPEAELRLTYARAVRELLERCSAGGDEQKTGGDQRLG